MPLQSAAASFGTVHVTISSCSILIRPRNSHLAIRCREATGSVDAVVGGMLAYSDLLRLTRTLAQNLTIQIRRPTSCIRRKGLLLCPARRWGGRIFGEIAYIAYRTVLLAFVLVVGPWRDFGGRQVGQLLEPGKSTLSSSRRDKGDFAAPSGLHW